LADRIEGKLPNAGALLPLREGILAHIAERAQERRFPLTPQQIVHDVRRVMPEDGIVCLDNGMYKIWFARNYRTHVANTLLLDNALATMERACRPRSRLRCSIPVGPYSPCVATAAS
jgi:acetolactate synthase-1/2/3 large subunit